MYKIDDMKDSFHEELEHVVDRFSKYLMKMLGEFQCQSR
jgi:hypothetical protein